MHDLLGDTNHTANLRRRFIDAELSDTGTDQVR